MLERRERGFSFVEALVTVAVMITVVLGLYTLLDRGNKLAKQETNVAEAQQSSRVGIYELSRVIRQGRVGGLFFANAILPISNNSPGGDKLTDLSGIDHYIRAGTDVIEVRGILSGDKYYFAPGDIACAGSCATTTSATVTIHATSTGGVSNFAPGSAPSLISRTRPFFFVVAAGANDVVTIGSSDYLVSEYIVGLVNTAVTPWYSQTANTFTFTMNPQDAEAKKLNASTSVASSIDKPFSGGPVDKVRFFVDEGPVNASSLNTDTHPTLVEATLVPDPSNLKYDIQPLVDEVEDFQIAYGVDGADGSVHDKGVDPTKVTTTPNNDEWVGNVAGDDLSKLALSSSEPKYVAGFVDTTVPTASSAPALALPSLRSVWISLVVKSTDPDFVYGGPGARGIQILDSPQSLGVTAKNFSKATGRPYRRRLQSFAVSLRNYQ